MRYPRTFTAVVAAVLALGFTVLVPGRAFGLVEPSFGVFPSVTSNNISVTANVSCRSGNTNKTMDSNAVSFSLSTVLGNQEPLVSRGSTFTSMVVSYTKPNVTTSTSYSITVTVNATGVVCDQTGYTNSRTVTVTVDPPPAPEPTPTPEPTPEPSPTPTGEQSPTPTPTPEPTPEPSASPSDAPTPTPSAPAPPPAPESMPSPSTPSSGGGSVLQPSPSPKPSVTTAAPTPAAPTTSPSPTPEATASPSLASPSPSTSPTTPSVIATLPTSGNRAQTALTWSARATAFSGIALKASVRKQLVAAMDDVADATPVTCTPYLERTSQRALMQQRASAVCAAIRRENPRLTVTVGSPRVGAPARVVVRTRP